MLTIIFIGMEFSNFRHHINHINHIIQFLLIAD